MNIKAMIGTSSTADSKQLVSILNALDFFVVDTAIDGHDLLRKTHHIYPDIIIVDEKIKNISGLEIAEIILEDSICPVIVLISNKEGLYFGNLRSDTGFSYIEKPVDTRLLERTIELLVKTHKRIRELESQVSTLKKQVSDKNGIDFAKKLLIQYENMTEEQAHKFIQKKSMNKGVSKMQIASEIVRKYKKN